MSERVTLENFDRAESDRYFASVVQHGGFGRLEHERMLAPIEQQTVPRGNRDTLYSSGVFDLEAAAVAITLPESHGRFMSLIVVDEDLYSHAEINVPGRYTFTRAAVGTRYVLVEVRLFVDARDAADVEAVHALQDAVIVEQKHTGRFEVPAWDDTSETRVRDALLALRETVGDSNRMFGSRFETDPVRHLVGCAATGGASDRGVLAFEVTPAANDGFTVHRIVLRDVPVDAFWSVSVYNRAGLFEKNDLDAYTVNSVTAERNHDGSISVQLGCDHGAVNCLPITPGWSYVVRLYRPRAEVLEGEWAFPLAIPVTSTFADAVDLVMWGLPIVASAAIRHAFVHDASARENDIVYWREPAACLAQFPMLHGASRYVLVTFETFHGPVVLEIPPGNGGALAGSIVDAWQLPVADVGPAGGRFLLVPPGDASGVVADRTCLPLRTYSGYALLRAVGDGSLDLVRDIRVLPVDDRRAAAEPHLIDMTGRPFEGLVSFDERFFDELAKIVSVEPVPERDRERISVLARVGHASGELLASAAHAAHELLVRRVAEHGALVWPARRWRRLDDVEAHQGGEEIVREIVAFRHCAPAVLGTDGLWLHAFVDARGHVLSRGRSYRLRIPAGAPPWRATVYDRGTCAFIRNAGSVEVASGDPGLVIEPDGSVELDFAGEPRGGRDASFLDVSGRGSWFVTLQLDALPPDGWELRDLELVDEP